ncbi:hypothetical protein [Primorskyibacter sp. S87]|uniref:hypothetical protein n=1 Tax=Primorskyibacter sp. S87 TaxID=3415126 RepID=UPI003C797B76
MCRVVITIFSGIYLLALLLFLVGTFGWFGQEQDPLSGLFLLPLGLPWNLLLDGAPDAAKPVLAALSPLLNLILMTVICRRLRKRR